jgi:hypothetical protein
MHYFTSAPRAQSFSNQLLNWSQKFPASHTHKRHLLRSRVQVTRALARAKKVSPWQAASEDEFSIGYNLFSGSGISKRMEIHPEPTQERE